MDNLAQESQLARPGQAFDFSRRLKQAGLDQKARRLDTLQINITKLCNQACVHCHVDASPRRREMMSEEHLQNILAILAAEPQIQTVDITGGAPELHPGFRSFVRQVRLLQRKVIVRHNLTVTFDPHPLTGESMLDLPDFFAEQGLEIVSSLPSPQAFFTDKQRGSGVFEKSIAGLQRLNTLGFGKDDPKLLLHLVYNPSGAFLPGDQASLEKEYKAQLWETYGIQFHQLYCLANLPIHRFKAQLKRAQAYESYMETLSQAFNPRAAEGIMCRSLISVSHDGKLYDCDFNQMLGMPIESSLELKDFQLSQLVSRTIQVASHCFACTAGAGSSCAGATV